MKDISGKLEYKGTEYKVVFNLNVIEKIQEEYGSIEKWGEVTSSGEGNAKAIKFGFWAMINEGIEITNEDTGENVKPLTLSQVGRILTDIGLENATELLHKTVVDSTKSEEKNA